MYKYLTNYLKLLGKIIKTKQEIKKYKLNLESKQSKCMHLYVYAGNEEITSDSYPVTYEEYYTVVCSKCGFERSVHTRRECRFLINKSEIINRDKI